MPTNGRKRYGFNLPIPVTLNELKIIHYHEGDLS